MPPTTPMAATRRIETRLLDEGKIAHQPEDDAAQFGIRTDRQHQADHSTPAGSNNDTRQQQPVSAPSAGTAGQAKYQQGAAKRSAKGRHIHLRPVAPSSMAPSAVTAAPLEVPST